ncbi:MAG: hypothetical protein KJ668_05570, partial [Proteobacteria bacterium]|nr:hypothetical protein [Pseudomonadota bacterium]
MTIRLRFNLFTALLSLVLAGVFAGPADCQEINLDKMKKLEGLVCYQSLKDPAIWYYLPDQPRLAMKNGKPQFSFMKYSRTQKTGKAGTNTAEGGGIVHFLVTYGAGKDRVAAAQRRLQEIQPDARIEGPIVYRKGSFALITSFGQDQETLVRTVAVGKAPLMEGQKAAVSMALSRQGAQLLWESFKGDTPDISLVFDMEFAGVREPYEATIEADWSRVSKHKRLKAGMKYSWFGADVDMLFQELRQDGAIKITTKGENASMDRIIESANAKLLQVMFDPAPVDDLSRAAAENNSYSSLNQAMKMLKEDSTATSGKKSSLNLNSPGFRQMIGSILDHLITNVYASSETSVSPDTAEAPTLPPLPETKTETSGKLTAEQTAGLNELFSHGQKLYDEKQYQEALDVYQEWEKQHYDLVGKEHAGIVWSIASCQLKLTRYDEAADSFRRSADIVGRESEGGRECLKMANQADKLAMEKNMSTTVTKSESPNPNEQVSDTSASDAYNQARRLDEEARRQGYPRDATKKAIDAYEAYQLGHSPTGARAGEIEGRLRSLKKRLATDELEDTADSDTKASELKKPEETPLAPVPSGTPSSSSTAGNSLAPSVGSTGTSVPLNSTTAKPAAATPKTTALKKAAAAKKPGFSLVASFQMKNIKRSGRMVYQMNH